MSNQMQQENPMAEQEQTAQEPLEPQEQEAQTPAEDLPSEAQAAEQPSEETAPQEEPPPEKTEAQLLSEQLEELNDRYLRTLAEYGNFRKRSQQEKDEVYPRAVANTIEAFVPILDTFERALSAPCTDEGFKRGVEMILHNFKEVLTRQGVEEFGVAGEPFDPQMHNAVMHIEDEEFAENSIVEVFQKGYRLGERIIRHAMVKVAN